MFRINLEEKTMNMSSVRAFAVAAIGVSVLLSSCGRNEVVEQAPIVRAVKVVTVAGDNAQSRTFPGRVEASDQVDLSFRVDGPLIEFPVLEGNFVKKGQLVARIDPRDYRIRLDAARAEVERTDADFRRYSALYEKDAVSKAQLDQALAARDIARAQEEDAEANLEDTFLRAPFSGRIAETFVENFQDVQAKEPILSLVNVKQVEIVIDVPENLVARFRVVQRDSRIAASFDAAPGREFDARVSEVATQADPRTQSFRVTFALPQPEGVNVLPGMTANVTRYPPPGESVEIVVPAIAVFADEAGSSHVWVVDRKTGTVERRPVRTGDLSGTDSIVVLEGLVQGEDVAVSAVSQIRDGMTVRPIEEVSGL
jgi:multidrug efflux system membrane fusion protein